MVAWRPFGLGLGRKEQQKIPAVSFFSPKKIGSDSVRKTVGVDKDSKVQPFIKCHRAEVQNQQQQLIGIYCIFSCNERLTHKKVEENCDPFSCELKSEEKKKCPNRAIVFACLPTRRE